MIEPQVLSSLESWLGFSIDPKADIPVARSSARRSDEPFNRFVVNMIIETKSICVSCTPRLLPKISKAIDENSDFELFSEFGLNQISLLLQEENITVGTGFSYGMSSLTELKTLNHPFEIVQSIRTGESTRFEYSEDGQLAGWAEVYNRDESGCQFIDVETDTRFRGRGIATALVYEATHWILQNGKVARYGAEKSNFTSLRLAKRLGYRLLTQHIVG